MSTTPQSNSHGAATNFELLKNSIQKEQDNLQKLTQEVKHHEDNLKFLKSNVNIIHESIHHLQGELKECHSSVVAVESNGNITFINSEKQTLDHIQQLDETAAGIICQVKDQHGSVASTLRCTKDIVGIVASLGKVKDEELSRNTGLHGIAPTIGRTMKGRFHVFCLQSFRPFVGEFLSDDPQKKLALMNPRLPNGKLPPGFLGFAVNMISLDDIHLSCVTVDGYGLRETLFFNLFSRLQVYKSRADMLSAQPFITDGAVSLDGGMIRGCGLFCLGDRNEIKVQFPLVDSKPSIPREVLEIEQQIKFMEWKKEMLSSDIQREESLLNTVKCLLKAKSDGYRKLINDELLNKGRSPPLGQSTQAL
ncbi:protein DEFECTIVE IN MERISTEM SILENCING 3 isoform X2 [Dendrobium catenatum]|uniref:protein DEFECTIVE IN MERISTEM SILENCING 3 isoform X2 n=1 Tax=Dendrobium catenatum TaxID=906689 RepID=UPI0009F6B8A1|nr:protein DEFECTIVE IN MERISTEM SILENCING 3 isoform X2 [Dendrobium catenatum]